VFGDSNKFTPRKGRLKRDAGGREWSRLGARGFGQRHGNTPACPLTLIGWDIVSPNLTNVDVSTSNPSSAPIEGQHRRRGMSPNPFA